MATSTKQSALVQAWVPQELKSYLKYRAARDYVTEASIVRRALADLREHDPYNQNELEAQA